MGRRILCYRRRQGCLLETPQPPGTQRGRRGWEKRPDEVQRNPARQLLAGDEEIKTDDALFLGVSTKLGELVEVKEAELKKL